MIKQDYKWMIFIVCFLILGSVMVMARDVTPQGDFNGQNVFNIKNFSDINGTRIFAENNVTSHGWFVGKFNWFIDSAMDILFNWNGTTLTRDETAWNATVDNRVDLKIKDNNASWTNTYNSTYDSLIRQNSSLWSESFDKYNSSYESTYNITYNSLILQNNSLWTEAFDKYNLSYTSTYNSTYNSLINQNASLWNEVLNKYNSTYNSLITQNSTLWNEALNKYNLTYESTYNSTYNSLILQNDSLWTEAYDKYNASYVDTNESNRWNNAVAFPCSGTNKMSGFYTNGSINCTADVGGSIYNSTYDSLINQNSSLWSEALDKFNISYEANYNDTYDSLINQNSSLWTEAYNKFNASYSTGTTNIFDQNLSIPNNVSFVDVTVTGWLRGKLEMWFTSAASIFFSWNGTTLDFDDDKLNATIDDIAEEYNETTWILSKGYITEYFNATTVCSGDQVLMGNGSCQDSTEFFDAGNTFNSTYDSLIVNNASLWGEAFDKYNVSYLSTYNLTYDDLVVNNASLWTEALDKSNSSYLTSFTYTNATTICYGAEFLGGNGSCFNRTVDTDTNDYSYNTTYALWAHNQTTPAIAYTDAQGYITEYFNATTICYGSEFLGGNGSCFNRTVDTDTTDGSYNTTYDTWSYNQTTPAEDYADATFLPLTENSSLWASIALKLNITDQRYNETTWILAQGYGSTYNATYSLWTYNQTTAAITYVDATFLPLTENISLWTEAFDKYNSTYAISLGSVCSGTDKMSGFYLNGSINCTTDQTLISTYNSTYDSLVNQNASLWLESLDKYNASYDSTYNDTYDSLVGQNISLWNEALDKSNATLVPYTGATANLAFGIYNITANWFKGAFNWVIGAGTSQSYLAFNNTDLILNDTFLNGTIDDIAEEYNETAWVLGLGYASTFNDSYHALILQNTSLWAEAFDKYNASYLSTYNLSYDSLVTTNASLWSESLDKFNASYVEDTGDTMTGNLTLDNVDIIQHNNSHCYGGPACPAYVRYNGTSLIIGVT